MFTIFIKLAIFQSNVNDIDLNWIGLNRYRADRESV